jgi:Xaa-Pro dipeptidase
VTGNSVRDAEWTASARAARLLEAVAGQGQEAVVAYSAGRHFLADGDPVWWLTRHKPMAECLALIAPDGSIELLVSPAWDEGRARDAAPGVIVRTGDPLAVLASWRSRTGLAAGEVAFCGRRQVTARRLRDLEQELGPLADADATCEHLARQRDPADIALAEQAAALAEEGCRELLRVLRPGMAEFEVVARVHLQLRELGADDTFLLISSARHNLALHPPTERVLAKGDIVLMEISPAVAGVYSQICRTVVLGAPTGSVQEDFDLLSESLAAGARACSPGRQVSDVVAAMDEVIAGGGFADYCKPPYMRARGHGLGLASGMPGDLTRDNKRELVAGDVFVLHPNQYLPATGYLLCGEPLVVTNSGGKPLTGSFAPLGEVA